MAGPYPRPQSPIDGVFWKDDFVQNAIATTTNVGEKGWEFALIGNVSTVAYDTATDGGVLHVTTNATADGDGTYFRQFTDGLVIDGGLGGFSFRAQLADQIASNNFRIGLENSITAAEPTVGIYVQCDGGVISLRSDATGGDTITAAAGVSTFTSGTTMVVTTWHTFEVIWSGTNADGGPRLVELFIDGELAASLLSSLDDDETVELKMTHWQDSGGALAVELLVDWFEYWAWIDRR
jgi:hypothetical protein